MTDCAIQSSKTMLFISAILLAGCNNDMPLLFPDQQDIHFKCDMDPYRQGCERQLDYQEHFRWIKSPEK